VHVANTSGVGLDLYPYCNSIPVLILFARHAIAQGCQGARVMNYAPFIKMW